MLNEEIVEQLQKGIDITENQKRLWTNNEKFVRLVVKQSCGYSSEYEDYIQQGFIGLIDAAMRYHAEEGTQFLTYAKYYIRRSIIRYSENCCHSVRTPIYLLHRIRKYELYRQQVMEERGTEPTNEELMKQLNISALSLKHLKKTIYEMRTVSIDIDISPSEDKGTSLIDMLSADEDIEELITHSEYLKQLKAALDDALSILDDTTRAMIQSCYYQGNARDYTANVFGCSSQNVSERIGKGFWNILHSQKRKSLETFMWDGYKYNEYQYSEYAEDAEDENEFLI